MNPSPDPLQNTAAGSSGSGSETANVRSQQDAMPAGGANPSDANPTNDAESTPQDERLSSLETAGLNIATQIIRGSSMMTRPSPLETAGRASGLSQSEALAAMRQGLEAGCASAGTTKQSDRLMNIALELFRFGRTDKCELFGVRKNGPNVAIMLDGGSKDLQAELAREMRRRHREVASETTLSAAIMSLRGRRWMRRPSRCSCVWLSTKTASCWISAGPMVRLSW